MRILLVAVAGSVLALAYFAREFLIERESRNVILGLALALFVAAILLPIFMPGKPVLYPSLMNPLVSLSLFLLMRKVFLHRKNREPIDTFFDWRAGLGADRVFNIVYFTLGTFLTFLLWIGANETGYEWR